MNALGCVMPLCTEIFLRHVFAKHASFGLCFKKKPIDMIKLGGGIIKAQVIDLAFFLLFTTDLLCSYTPALAKTNMLSPLL